MRVSASYLSNLRYIKKTLILLGIIVLFAHASMAFTDDNERFNPGEMIMHDITDDYSWHFVDGKYGTLYLPIIVYSKDRGLEIFSSRNFYDEQHNPVPYNGYILDHKQIKPVDINSSVYDFSITKNVLTLFILAIAVFWIFTSVARGFKKNEGSAPSGIQSFFEPIIIYIRDEIVKPNIGPKYERYLPYLLTLFFFVWIGNIQGLLPGASNLTGNIAVTMVLAIITFFLTSFSGTRNYWGHIFNPHGVPLPIKPMIILVEFIGLFTKPISLTIRLFVAITAGHIVLLSLISLTFIFNSWFVGIGASLLVLFINLIEILVATIQAYIFTMFSSLYIGMALDKGEDH